MLVLPADHLIKNQALFHEVLDIGVRHAMAGRLVSVGVSPSRSATGFGYIKSELTGSDGAYPISEFIEKPNAFEAEKMWREDSYLWNSGMFMFDPKTYLEELQRYRNDILEYCKSAYKASFQDMGFIKINEDEFSDCPTESIDYAVMEKTKNAVVVPFDGEWSDIGSWEAVHRNWVQDESGNSHVGSVVFENVQDSCVLSEKRLIVASNLSDVLVVESDDAILVAKLSTSESVKSIVEQLRRHGRPETELHRKVFRPWGSYDSLEYGEGFQVKKLVVKPGQQLSLQSHKQRAEHWIVVKGLAEVTNAGKTFFLHENESTYIPIGVKHSLSNPGETDLEIIEVQSGDYLGEDDIERYDDIYGRHI